MCKIFYVASGDFFVGGNCQKWRTYNTKKRSLLEEEVTNAKDYDSWYAKKRIVDMRERMHRCRVRKVGKDKNVVVEDEVVPQNV